MANDALTASFGLDIAPLTQSLNRATASVTDAAAKMGRGAFGDMIAPILKVTAAVSSVGAVMDGIKGALDLGSEMTDLANRTGLAVESAYGLRRAFKDAGVDANALGPAVNKMQKSLASAVAGGAEGNTLKALGLDPQALASMDPGKAFARIGNSIAQLPNATQRAAAAISIFGKSGAELLQVFMDPNFKDAGNISNTAKLLGQNAGIFDKASDALGHVGPKLQGLFIGMASGATDLLNKMADGIDSLDLSGLGKAWGYLIGNFSTNWKAASKVLLADLSQVIGLALSGDSVQLFGFELIKAGSLLKDALFTAFKEPLDYFGANVEFLTNKITNALNFKNVTPAGLREQRELRDKQASAINTKQDAFNNIEQLEIQKRRMMQADGVPGWKSKEMEAELNAKIEAQKRIMAGADNLISSTSSALENYGGRKQKSVEEIYQENKKNGTGTVDTNLASSREARDELNSRIEQLKAGLSDRASKLDIKSFVPTELTLANNKKATDANANRITGQGAYDASAIGQAAKASIIADSLAKVGGGGNAIGPASNPILEENKRQTAYLASINQGILRAAAQTGPIEAQFKSN